jgi:tripartite ATP-independent transporter DctP family solute receptor
MIPAMLAASTLLLAACGGGSGTSTGAGGKQVTIQLSIGDPANSSVGVTARHFADEVKKRTNGKVVVTVFPNGTTYGGDQNSAVTRVQNGTLDAVILSTSVYAALEPRMNAVSLPYLFKDTDQLASYLKGQPGKTLLDSLGKLNTKGLVLMTRTFRETTTSKRAITKPEDFAGLKMRVPNNELWTKFFAALGASPTPLAFSEVFTALQTGTIDGQENPIEVPLANKFYEVQKNLSLTNHMADAYVLAIGDKKWKSLDATTQQQVNEAADATAVFKTQYDAEQASKALADLKAKGMRVNELDPAARAAFEADAQKLYPSFEQLVGKEFMQETLQFLGRK